METAENCASHDLCNLGRRNVCRDLAAVGIPRQVQESPVRGSSVASLLKSPYALKSLHLWSPDRYPFQTMFTLLFSLRDCFRSRAVLQAEILALRQQLLVLQRSPAAIACVCVGVTEPCGLGSHANEPDLRRVLKSYFAYYERSRTHLGKDAPINRPIQSPAMGRVVEIPQVGGLHHRYERVVA